MKIIASIRARLAARRERRERARVHALWNAEAVAPEAMRMAAEMAVEA